MINIAMEKMKPFVLAFLASKTIDQLESARAFQKFYLRRKLIQFGFAVAVLALGAFCFVAVRGTSHLVTVAQSGAPVQHYVGSLQKLLGQLSETEVNARAYLLTAEPQYLKRDEVGSTEAEQELVGLRRQVATDMARASHVNKLKFASQAVLTLMRQVARGVQREETPAPEQARTLLASNLLEGIQHTVHEAQDSELRRAKAPWAVAQVRAKRTLGLVAVASLLATGLVLLAKWIMWHDLKKHRLGAGLVFRNV